jgi:type IV secretion system protein VirD4
MPATRILWGAILVVFSIVLATTRGATQWTAWQLDFQSELGPAWIRCEFATKRDPGFDQAVAIELKG